MNILLIYELIPENTFIYLFEDLTPEEFERLRNFHGHIFNTTQEEKDYQWFEKFLSEHETCKIYNSENTSGEDISIRNACELVWVGFAL